MIKEIKKFVIDDGREFNTYKEAMDNDPNTEKFEIPFHIATKEESEAYDNVNPYHVFDGKWGGWGNSPTWIKCTDTGDVVEINDGNEELTIIRVWRNKEQEWDKSILATDYGQLRREVNIRAINEEREARRNRPIPKFDKFIFPIITRDIEALKEYPYDDIRTILLRK